LFAGIVQGKRRVVRVSRAGQAAAASGEVTCLRIALDDLAAGLQLGASVAVNGACLTVTRLDGGEAEFDVIPETMQRTNLGALQPGTWVNIERSLRLGDPVDGHLVQGHVEGVATVDEIDRAGGGYKLWFRPPAELMAYLTPKGGVCLDGVSLTLVDVEAERASVALIPTTLQWTTLGEREAGDRINVETDVMARLVVQRVDQMIGALLKSPGNAARFAAGSGAGL
jgi:riboflavin synthase alpha subunit